MFVRCARTRFTLRTISKKDAFVSWWNLILNQKSQPCPMCIYTTCYGIVWFVFALALRVSDCIKLDKTIIHIEKAYTNLQIVMREKKRRNSSIYVCWVRAYCATTINDHKCSIDRWQKWMTTWCVAMLSSAIVYWHDAPQFVTNEFCDWIYPTHSHIHISLQCIQKQQQQLGDRVEFNLPNNRKLKLRLCKTDSIWKLIDSYVNIFLAVISNQCVENLFSA